VAETSKGLRRGLVDVAYDEGVSATGAKSEELQKVLVHQILQTLRLSQHVSDEERITSVKAALAALSGIKPEDEVEGMLAVQMVVTHNMALDCLGRAAVPEQSFEAREMNLRHAEKLMATYLRQVEVLDKRRGKGQQTVTVKYVNVEPGGQAVVGTVHTGRLSGQDTADTSASLEAVAPQVIAPLTRNERLPAVRAKRKGSPR
jgi:hypothetical protein